MKYKIKTVAEIVKLMADMPGFRIANDGFIEAVSDNGPVVLTSDMRKACGKTFYKEDFIKMHFPKFMCEEVEDEYVPFDHTWEIPVGAMFRFIMEPNYLFSISTISCIEIEKIRMTKDDRWLNMEDLFVLCNMTTDNGKTFTPAGKKVEN